jgi:hypothetical protein
LQALEAEGDGADLGWWKVLLGAAVRRVTS